MDVTVHRALGIVEGKWSVALTAADAAGERAEWSTARTVQVAGKTGVPFFEDSVAQ